MGELEQKVINAISLGKSNSEIKNEFGVTLSYIKYRRSEKFKDVIERKKAKELNDKEFEKLVIKVLPYSNSLNNICTKLGLRGVEGYYDKIRKIITKYNLDTSHFGTLNVNSNFKELSDEEFFTNGVKRNGKSIVKRLIDHCYKSYCCENPECSISEWHGKALTLQCHHINGNHYDNRIENLLILCPNCHSQTDTYGIGTRKYIKKSEPKFLTKKDNIDLEDFNIVQIKDIQKKYCYICGKELNENSKKYCSHKCAQKGSMSKLPEINILIEDFKKYGSFVQIAKQYGVSDKCISKRFKKNGIPHKSKELKEYIKKMGTDA